ncbi:MAG: hypothetical protein IT320_11270 [Anaerolineae bacterium]|nr:hypothetical protein [Anaerolineae bacterium]
MPRSTKAASEGQRDILITMGVDSRKLAHEGPHVLEIRNRAERHAESSGYKLRFKQLVVADKTYALHTIRYHYDHLARLTEARYAPGINAGAADADLLRRYQYSYDLAGNRVQQIETVAGTPTTTNYTFNAANQMTTAGGATLTYDDNGNLTSDGTNTYAWDRANRLLSMGGASYAYDGLNNRVSQTISSTVTQYLLDLQPGLSVVLAAATGANTDRYVHGPRGIHAQRDTADNWEWMVQDGLGSVRGVADNTGVVQWSVSFADYGTPYDEVGTSQTMYGFTGEPTNETGLVHLRARDYNPALGIFTALDPFEGMAQRPMSLNGYSWVEGNVPNLIDPSGMQVDPYTVEPGGGGGTLIGPIPSEYSVRLMFSGGNLYTVGSGGTSNPALVTARGYVMSPVGGQIPAAAAGQATGPVTSYPLMPNQLAFWQNRLGLSLFGSDLTSQNDPAAQLNAQFCPVATSAAVETTSSTPSTPAPQPTPTATPEPDRIYQFSNRDGSFKNGPSGNDPDGISVAMAYKCSNNPPTCLSLMFGRPATVGDLYRTTRKLILESEALGFTVDENGGQPDGRGGVYPEPHASVTHPNQTYRDNGSPQWSSTLKSAFGGAFGLPMPIM